MNRWILSALIGTLAFACTTEPPSSGTLLPLVDQGFEIGRLADRPTEGWYSDAARDGGIRVVRDTESFAHGRASLSVEVLRAATREGGTASISQVIELAGTAAADLEFSFDLRGESKEPVWLVACVWDEGVARTIAWQKVAVRSEWARSAVRFSVPEDRREVGLFVYFPAEAGSHVWVDGARLERVRG